MILDHSPDIDPDLFCYETNLSFGESFCKSLLGEIKKDPSFLISRSTYLDPNKNIDKIFEKLDFKEQKIFIRRMNQYKNEYANKIPIEFFQYALPDNLETEFKKTFPPWLLNISAGEPRIAIQLSQNGEIMAPHEDPKRSSAMFMLLQGNEETHWHRFTDTFKVFDFFNVPDLDKIETVVRAQIEPFKWTVFNHKACHSVHKFSKSGLRISIQLEFDNVLAEDLVKIVKYNESPPHA